MLSSLSPEGSYEDAVRWETCTQHNTWKVWSLHAPSVGHATSLAFNSPSEKRSTYRVETLSTHVPSFVEDARYSEGCLKHLNGVFQLEIRLLLSVWYNLETCPSVGWL